MARHSIAKARRVPKYPAGPHAGAIRATMTELAHWRVHPSDVFYIRGYNGARPEIVVRWGFDDDGHALCSSAADFLDNDSFL